MKTIILTGFKPFGNYHFNPTEQSTLDFDGKVFDDRKVVGLVLPSTYKAWGSLVGPIAREKPYAIINTGLSSSVHGIRIESTFRNIMNGKYPDANGFSPQNKPILDGEEVFDCVESKAPHDKLFAMLVQNGIPAECSNDADSFICNALGYVMSLGARMKVYNNRNLFIHIPWTTDYQDKVELEDGKEFMEKDLYYRGLELLIRNI